MKHNSGNLQKIIIADTVLTSADTGYLIWCNSAATITITINDDLGQAFFCEFYNKSVGQVVFVSGTATVKYPDGTKLEEDKVCTLLKVLNTNEHKLKGELTT